MISMKRLVTRAVILLTVIAAGYYVIILGGPIKQSISIGSCHEEYTYFITDNTFQDWNTAGHATDNFMEVGNAYRFVGKCLCQEPHSETTRKNLINILKSDKMIYLSYRRIKQLYRVGTDSIKIACDHSKEIFERLAID